MFSTLPIRLLAKNNIFLFSNDGEIMLIFNQALSQFTLIASKDFKGLFSTSMSRGVSPSTPQYASPSLFYKIKNKTTYTTEQNNITYPLMDIFVIEQTVFCLTFLYFSYHPCTNANRLQFNYGNPED